MKEIYIVSHWWHLSGNASGHANPFTLTQNKCVDQERHNSLKTSIFQEKGLQRQLLYFSHDKFPLNMYKMSALHPLTVRFKMNLHIVSKIPAFYIWLKKYPTKMYQHWIVYFFSYFIQMTEKAIIMTWKHFCLSAFPKVISRLKVVSSTCISFILNIFILLVLCIGMPFPFIAIVIYYLIGRLNGQVALKEKCMCSRLWY